MIKKCVLTASIATLGLMLATQTGCQVRLPIIEQVATQTIQPTLPPGKYSDEMYTLSRTQAETNEDYRRTMDINHRLLREEWNSFWMFDHPQRHHRLPIR